MQSNIKPGIEEKHTFVKFSSPTKKLKLEQLRQILEVLRMQQEILLSKISQNYRMDNSKSISTR